MNKVYTLDDNGECMAELKAMHEEMLLMKRRLECDEIKEAISRMRDELSLRDADLERQKRERAAELNMSYEEYEEYLKSLIIK